MKEKLRMLFDEKLWKFLLVGVLNTLVGNGLMFLLYNLAGFSYWPATGLSYALASVMSYFLNRYFTFQISGQRLGDGPALRAEYCRVLRPCLWPCQAARAADLLRPAEKMGGESGHAGGNGPLCGVQLLRPALFAFREKKAE